uniref:C-type lectin domain family 4 member E-like n=1 Tax=Semicossyphus pulcher TaxID=241346 RepID=UPI0037E71677
MEEIYANIEYEKPVDATPSTYQTGPTSSKRRLHGVLLFLGLLSVLLLAAVIGLCIYSHHLSAESSNLTERLQASDDQLSSLIKQRDLLNVSLTETTKKLERLQSLSGQKKTCPSGWKMFRCSCYLFSTQSSSWEESRQDCSDREADLVIIDSSEEQEFLSKTIKQDSWIGLSDRDNEGTWKWTDDTPLTLKFWWSKQPDNGDGDPRWGEEDCVHIITNEKLEENWNDRRCDVSMKWICEK